MNDLISFEEELEKNAMILHTNKGVSMMPLLRQGRDVMIISRATGRLKKYDAPLYKRPNGDYVVHRILRVDKDSYVICGDNCFRREFGIADSQIIGVLTGIIRDGKTIPVTSKKYKLYVHLWCDFFYIRAAVLYLKSKLAGLRNRMLGRGQRR